MPLGPDEVIETHLLKSRPPRARDTEAESAALLTLAQALNDDPGSLAQRLVNAARDLTGAPSAGLSLTDVEDGRPIFRWIATTGEYARYLNGTMPRDFSPCGEVLKRGEPLLMRQMRRVYTYVDALHAPPAEVLLVPFADNGQLVGTIWVAAHDPQHLFDAEDLRVVQSLAFFASAVSGTIGLVRSLQAREALQAKELAISERQRLQMGRLFQQAPGFFALLDGPQHTLAIVNDAFQRLTGQRAVVGARLLDVLPELRGQGIAEMLHRAFTTGAAQHGHDVSLTLASAQGAQQITVDFVYQPVVDATGAVTGVLLQGHDMTERRRAVDALQEADRHKDEFLALLAHEIRTPLSSIRLANQVLRQLPAEREPRHVRATDVIERQASTLSAMVDDLMDLASVRAGKFVLRRARVVAGHDRQRTRSLPAGHHRARAAPGARHSGAIAVGGRGRAAAGAGVRQPGGQREQVQRPRHAHPARCQRHAQRRACERRRRRAGHRPRHAAPHLRPVHAGLDR